MKNVNAARYKPCSRNEHRRKSGIIPQRFHAQSVPNRTRSTGRVTPRRTRPVLRSRLGEGASPGFANFFAPRATSLRDCADFGGGRRDALVAGVRRAKILAKLPTVCTPLCAFDTAVPHEYTMKPTNAQYAPTPRPVPCPASQRLAARIVSHPPPPPRRNDSGVAGVSNTQRKRATARVLS